MSNKVNKNNQYRVSVYSGKDVAGFQQFVDVKWGNEVRTAEWLHAFNSKLLLNTALHYSSYGYGFHIDVQDEIQFDWTSRLKEHSARLDFEYSLNKENLLQFGYNASRRVFSPIYMRVEENNTTFSDIQLDEKHVLEHALYIHNQHELNDKLSLVYGLRYSLFHNLGPGRVFLYEDHQPKSLESISDTLYFNAGQIQNTYHGPEPRLIGRYLLSEESSLKFSYNRMQQYSQVASSATASLPTDRWIPADRYVKPQRADQWSLGYFRSLPQRKLGFSAEVYYKSMRNQIDFKDGVTVMDNLNDENADIIFNNAIETQLLSGRAWSYGLEVMIEKKKGNFSGWLVWQNDSLRKNGPVTGYFATFSSATNNPPLSLQYPDPFEQGDRLLFQTIKMDKAVYTYYQGLLELMVTDGGLFGPVPVNPASNISGGALGVFQAGSITETAVVIE